MKKVSVNAHSRSWPGTKSERKAKKPKQQKKGKKPMQIKLFPR